MSKISRTRTHRMQPAIVLLVLARFFVYMIRSAKDTCIAQYLQTNFVLALVLILDFASSVGVVCCERRCELGQSRSEHLEDSRTGLPARRPAGKDCRHDAEDSEEHESCTMVPSLLSQAADCPAVICSSSV